MIWVLSTGASFYVGQMDRGKFHHSSFLQGDPIRGGGECAFDRGKLMVIGNGTGHYTCSPANLYLSLLALSFRLDVRDTVVSIILPDGKTRRLVKATDYLARLGDLDACESFDVGPEIWQWAADCRRRGASFGQELDGRLKQKSARRPRAGAHRKAKAINVKPWKGQDLVTNLDGGRFVAPALTEEQKLALIVKSVAGTGWKVIDVTVQPYDQTVWALEWTGNGPPSPPPPACSDLYFWLSEDEPVCDNWGEFLSEWQAANLALAE
jgi:hypothetical protein